MYVYMLTLLGGAGSCRYARGKRSGEAFDRTSCSDGGNAYSGEYSNGNSLSLSLSLPASSCLHLWYFMCVCMYSK